MEFTLTDITPIALALLLPIGGLLLFYILFLKFGIISLRPLPGPEGLPIVGNLLQVDGEKNPHLQLATWARQFGEVYQFMFLRRRVIVLNSLESIEEAAGRRGCDYSGVHDLWSNVFGDFSKEQELLWSQYGEKMHDKLDALLEAHLMDNIEKMIGEFRCMKNVDFDPLQILYKFSSRTLLNMTFGRNVSGYHHEKLMSLLKMKERKCLDRASYGRTRFLRNISTLYRPIKCNEIEEFFEKLYTELGNDGKSRDKSLLDFLQRESVSDIHSDDRPLLKSKDLVDVISHFVVRGTEILTSSLYSQILLMTSFPTIQERLQTEVDEMFSVGHSSGTQQDLQMPFIQAAILEMLRHTSPLPLGSSICTKRKTTMQGYYIPQGTPVIYNLWHINHDGDFWEDPWVYNPERFLSAEGKILPSEHTTRKRLLSFDVGRMQPFSERLLRKQLALVLPQLFREFSIVPGGESWGGNPDPRTFSLDNKPILMPGAYTIKTMPR